MHVQFFYANGVSIILRKEVMKMPYYVHECGGEPVHHCWTRKQAADMFRTLKSAAVDVISSCEKWL